MNFLHMNYLPGLLLAIAVIATVVVLIEKRFFKLIKTYWFYSRSIFSYISSACFLAGISLLAMSLLDARGPEERIKTAVPKDRTIILIDTSASMLAEDVGPSRLQKASLIAKHFARKAAGHQIAIVAFAEIQKKIVPFTNDIDLIDSRLESIKFLKNHNGSSALSNAIQESVQYFKETGGDAFGNILVLTDGEETSNGINLKVPKEVHVALVGIGTANGGRIPLDDSRGFRFGYKKSGGQDVVTKLNENYFKTVTTDIPSAKYWIANTYTLPSDEILEFFSSEKAKGTDQQDMVIRPVMMEWIVIPALILLSLSYVFKALRIFTMGLLLVCMPIQAQEEIQLSPQISKKLMRLQNGELNQLEKIKLADDLYKAGAKPEALSLYEENLPMGKIDKEIPAEAYLNYGTALLENKKPQEGFNVYQKLSESLPANSPLREIMDKNTVSYFKQMEQQKKKQKENKDNKDSDQNKNEGEQGQNQNQSSGQGQKDNKKKQGKGSENQDQQKDKEKEKEKNKDNSDENKDDENKQDNDQEQDKKPESSKQMPPKKLPAKLKQLMSDDRQLQMKLIESGTRELNKRKHDRKVKDW